LLDHLEHLLLHLFRRRLSLVSADRPGVAIGIDNVAAAIAPKHIHDRALAAGTKFGRFVDNLVHILYIKVQSRRGRSDVLGSALAHRRNLRSEHERCASQRELSMDRFPVRTVHNAPFREAQSFLVKAHGSRNIRDREHGRNSAVLLLIQRVNFLVRHSAPCRAEDILTKQPGRVHPATWGCP
jgi:hypothetical protein